MKLWLIAVLFLSTVQAFSPRFLLTSPDFAHGDDMSVNFTCDGDNRPPLLVWRNAPVGTQSFALVCRDTSASATAVTHWILFNISSEKQMVHFIGFEKGLDEVYDGMRQGRADDGTIGYTGPCPLHGKHRYVFILYALDVQTLYLGRSASYEDFYQALQDHVLDTAELIGFYGR